MYCPQCSDEISSNSVKQGTEFYCSLECANLAAGYDSEEEESYFEENTRTDLRKGQIIFLSTDGIWEAPNISGNMFGKERICDIIRRNASLSANEIVNVMIESLNSFRDGAEIEDDITLVLMKITG